MSATGCCGYNDGSITIQEARPGEKVMVTLPDGRQVEIQPTGGTWTNIDPNTGEVTSRPIEDVIKHGDAYRDAKNAALNAGIYTIHPPEDDNSSESDHQEDPGVAFLQSQQVALNMYARDLTDEELDDAYPYPGVGYDDSKWSGENPPQDEDEDGNPTYAAQQVFEDDEGTIYILEDNGEITEVA